jgi:hypothetical protein
MMAWVDENTEVQMVEADLIVRVEDNQVCEVWSIIEPELKELIGVWRE